MGHGVPAVDGGRPSNAEVQDLRAAQALADVARIGTLHERSFRATGLVRQQLQLALDSRVIIEQAKESVSHANDIPPDEAFELLRRYARTRQMHLADVARSVMQRTIEVARD